MKSTPTRARCYFGNDEGDEVDSDSCLRIKMEKGNLLDYKWQLTAFKP